MSGARGEGTKGAGSPRALAVAPQLPPGKVFMVISAQGHCIIPRCDLLNVIFARQHR